MACPASAGTSLRCVSLRRASALPGSASLIRRGVMHCQCRAMLCQRRALSCIALPQLSVAMPLLGHGRHSLALALPRSSLPSPAMATLVVVLHHAARLLLCGAGQSHALARDCDANALSHLSAPSKCFATLAPCLACQSSALQSPCCVHPRPAMPMLRVAMPCPADPLHCSALRGCTTLSPRSPPSSRQPSSSPSPDRKPGSGNTRRADRDV
jgi:hypothetical protein